LFCKIDVLTFSAIQDKVKHEKLLEYSLEVNDDINKTFSRYDNLKMGKKGTFTPSSTTFTYMGGKNDIAISSYKEQPRHEFKDTSTVVSKPSSNPVLIDMFETTTIKSTTPTNQTKNDLFDIFSQVPVTTNTSSTNIQTNFNMMNTGNISPMNNNVPSNTNFNMNSTKKDNLSDLLSQAYSNNIPTNVNTMVSSILTLANCQ
jgi:hypothetical protein